jgi:heme exporter protein CcmB
VTDPATAPREPGFLRQVMHVAAKDLRVEWRSREVLATMTFLAVVVVLIFSFAFVVEGARPPAPVVAGILWVAVVVSGTVALSRAFDREREGEAIRSLLLSPAPRSAIYIGKLAATAALMLMAETVLTGLCVVLFAANVDLIAHVALLLVLGTVGFAAVGCIFRRRCCARAAGTPCSRPCSTRSSSRSSSRARAARRNSST